jgi:glycosyltransferase involved in cell wall biosynthesis
MAKTIWFDISRIYNWNGPLVGFVRVELEIIRHFLIEFRSQTRFCRYDNMRDSHLEVSHEEVETHIQRLDSYVEGSPSHSSTGAGWNLRLFIRRVIRHLPQRLQSTVIQSLRGQWRAIAKIKRVSAGLLGRSLTLFHTPVSSIEQKLNQGDVYVTVGLNSESNIFPGIHAMKERAGIKVVGMCYDLIPVKFPHFLETGHSKIFSRFIIDMARCADMILCISQNTLHDLEQFLSTANERCPRLKVIRLGADIEKKTSAVSERIRTICRNPYILFVANVEPRKNHELLYRAYKKLVEEGQRDLPRLVLVGRTGAGTDSLPSNLRLDQSINGLVLMLNHVSDAELSYLYRHTLFTVFPSLYEGWGLPVAESLAYGKFCVASSASSLPEVGGDFAEYLDPSDLSAWIERLAYYFNNREAIHDREAEIRLHYKVYTWAQTARAIVNHALSL